MDGLQIRLAGLQSTDPRTRIDSVRNVIVFGRAVTNVLQNLRSTEGMFDEWYRHRRIRKWMSRAELKDKTVFPSALEGRYWEDRESHESVFPVHLLLRPMEFW